MKKWMMPLLVLAVIIVGCDKEDDPETQPTACFIYDSPTANSPLPYEIQFYNCSENAVSCLWDFGDGTTSTAMEPKHTFDDAMYFVVKLTVYNGSLSHTLTDTIKNWMIAYKPNIYLYPQETMDICVGLNFPKGGKILTSIPEYKNQWCINIEPNGKINNTYDYLFYESAQPNVWQTQKGWSIAKEDLAQFFKENLALYGFNSHEINDFIVYWIPLLTNTTHYNIYPQNTDLINSVIELSLSEEPENTNRMFYLIKEANHQKNLDAPIIKPFNKTGFYVNEWGVLLD